MALGLNWLELGRLGPGRKLATDLRQLELGRLLALLGLWRLLALGSRVLARRVRGLLAVWLRWLGTRVGV